MAQNEQNAVPMEPKLCSECLKMYGHPSFDNLCSSCFKKQKPSVEIQTPKKIEEKTPQLSREITEVIQKYQPEVSKKRLMPSQQEVKTVIGRCNKCSKKTSIYGHNCRHCSQQFCKFHRLPEEHDCGVDFVSLGRKQLKVDNPLVVKKKIEHI